MALGVAGPSPVGCVGAGMMLGGPLGVWEASDIGAGRDVAYEICA